MVESTPGPESLMVISTVLPGCRISVCTQGVRSSAGGELAAASMPFWIKLPQHGGHVERRLRLQRPQMGMVCDPKHHLPLGCHGRLRHQQGGNRWIVYAARHREVDGRPALGEGVHVAHHLLIVADLDQARDDVELVGELVGLCAEQVGGAAERPDLALQLGQLSAVA